MKYKIVTLVVGIMGLFLIPLALTQENPVDTEAIVIFDSFQDDENITDGKLKLVLRIGSAPTSTYSCCDMYYVDKVTVDMGKPQNINTKIINSVILKEAASGRNVTKITRIDTGQIYP